MALDLEGYLGKVERASGLEDIQTLIVMLRDHYSIDHIVYHWVSADGEQYGCGTYPASWVQHYIDKEYLRVDPVVIGCFNRFHPVDWKRLNWSSKQARAFRQDAIGFGIGNQGFSIPIRGPNGQFALFSVSHSCSDTEWVDFTKNHQRELILIAHYFNQKALEIGRSRAPEPMRKLSPREVDTLTFLAMGYNRAEVSEMLSISEHTLRAYIESARFKLGCANTTHAVARAMSEGLILWGGAARAAEGDWPGRQGTVPEAQPALQQRNARSR